MTLEVFSSTKEKLPASNTKTCQIGEKIAKSETWLALPAKAYLIPGRTVAPVHDR